jgi:Protein of unknown function (DUF2795)
MQEMRMSEIASQFVEGLDYPISKERILEAAREASIDPTVLDSLEKIPDREYSEPGELTQALNAT